MIKIIPILIGVIVSYLVGICMGEVDFTAVKEASFLAMPDFVLPFIDYKISFGAVLTIAPIALVTICEHIGDHKNLGNIINKDLLDYLFCYIDDDKSKHDNTDFHNHLFYQHTSFRKLVY